MADLNCQIGPAKPLKNVKFTAFTAAIGGSGLSTTALCYARIVSRILNKKVALLSFDPWFRNSFPKEDEYGVIYLNEIPQNIDIDELVLDIPYGIANYRDYLDMCECLVVVLGFYENRITIGEKYANIYSEKPATIVIMPPINQTNHAEAKDYFLKNASRLKKGKTIYILIDIANGHMKSMQDSIRHLKEVYGSKIEIMCGNIASSDICHKLLEYADILKIGIGSGAVCTTRKMTGCGVPMVSLILECSDIVHAVGGMICADGGLTEPGDICKALVAGADICMSGSLFAGCDEAAGNIITKHYRTNECLPEFYGCDVVYNNIVEQKKFKEYYGMSSFRAQHENYGKVTKSGTSEGVESKLIPYTGPIQNTINDINGSLRSCGTYLGASKIERFSVCGPFYRVNGVK